MKERQKIGLYSLRQRKDGFLFQLASIAHHRGVTPNVMTATGLCLGVTSGVLFMFRQVPLAFACGFLSVFCDVLDGTIARKFNMQTQFGLVFDSVADRSSELAVVLGALAGGIIQPLGVVAIVGSTALFLLRAVSHRRGLATDYVLFGRVERVSFIFVGLISPIVEVSTFCFVVAGAFGLFSSIQIIITLLRHPANVKFLTKRV